MVELDLMHFEREQNDRVHIVLGFRRQTDDEIQFEVRDAVAKHHIGGAKYVFFRYALVYHVAKPFTPFQWEPMDSVESLNKKQRSLDRAVRKIGNMNIIHDLPKWEYVQALLSRGDRRTGKLIRAAHEIGEDWKKAAKATAVDMDFYVYRRRKFSEHLPWDFIDIGVRKEYLKNEYQRALEGKFTPPCRVGSCKTCGVCQ